MSARGRVLASSPERASGADGFGRNGPRREPRTPSRSPAFRSFGRCSTTRTCGSRARIDRRWAYEDILPISLSGFNPLTRSVFYAAKSSMADWLLDPYGPSRAHNFRDRLVREVLMAAHDYLHIWAYGVVRDVCPGLGLGTRAITRARLDDFVFAHLLTEAAATVGLDYWYLGCVNLNQVCDVGTRVTGITTPSTTGTCPSTDASRRPSTSTRRRSSWPWPGDCTGTFAGFGAGITRRARCCTRGWTTR